MLTDNDYLFICELSNKATGINLDLSKKYLIDSRLSKFVIKNKLESPLALINLLRKEPFSHYTQELAYALLTHETLFFRDNKYFDEFINKVLPHCIENNELNIWSAACSTGQEPYSLCMAINESINIPKTTKLNVIASDISDDVIEFASNGRYSQMHINRGVNPVILNKYFKKINDRQWEIVPLIRNKITFKKINLIGALWGLPKLQVVFIRNVLIYFNEPERKQILNGVKRYLEDGGIVVTGTGEDISNIDDQFKKRNENGIIFFELKKWSLDI